MTEIVLNQLESVKFRLAIDRLPGVEYWMQSVNLPSVTLNSVPLDTPYINTMLPGTKIEFEPINIQFIVDQNLSNYFEIMSWFDQIQSSDNMKSVVSNFSIHFLDGNNTVNRTITFFDALPSLLGELQMQTNDNDSLAVTCALTMRYRYFRLEGSTKTPHFVDQKDTSIDPGLIQI